MNYKQAIETIQAEIESDPAVNELVEFIQSSSRGVYRPNRVLRSSIDDPDALDELVPFSDTLLETR
jgi:hypothetical protein